MKIQTKKKLMRAMNGICEAASNAGFHRETAQFAMHQFMVWFPYEMTGFDIEKAMLREEVLLSKFYS